MTILYGSAETVIATCGSQGPQGIQGIQGEIGPAGTSSLALTSGAFAITAGASGSIVTFSSGSVDYASIGSSGNLVISGTLVISTPALNGAYQVVGPNMLTSSQQVDTGGIWTGDITGGFSIDSPGGDQLFLNFESVPNLWYEVVFTKSGSGTLYFAGSSDKLLGSGTPGRAFSNYSGTFSILVSSRSTTCYAFIVAQTVFSGSVNITSIRSISGLNSRDVFVNNEVEMRFISGSTFIGRNSGIVAGGSCMGNVGIGNGTFQETNSAVNNVGIGEDSLHCLNKDPNHSNVYANNNVAVGAYSLSSLISGSRNTAIGESSLSYLYDGNYNCALGNWALLSLLTGSRNIAIGSEALTICPFTDDNIAVGVLTLNQLQRGGKNIAVGTRALQQIRDSYENIAIGNYAMGDAGGAGSNISDTIAIGSSSLRVMTTGSTNMAIGVEAFSFLTQGNNNIAVGRDAGRYLASLARVTRASSSLFIGNETKSKANSSNNEIVVGFSASGNGSNTVTLGNTNITGTYLQGQVYASGSPVGRKVAVPASAAATGSPGDFAVDASFLYFCVASSSWVRSSASTW